MKKNDWKDRLNIVYSTNPDFSYQLDEEEEPATVDPKQQRLRVSIEKKGRGGKQIIFRIDMQIEPNKYVKELTQAKYKYGFTTDVHLWWN